MNRTTCLCVLTLLCTLPTVCFASQLQPLQYAHNVLWVAVAAILVLFMTIPGVALFYGGLVARKNVLSIIAQSITITSLATVMWFLFGFGLSFSNGGILQPFIGSFTGFFIHRFPVMPNNMQGELTVQMFYQLGFAIITPVLIIGAFAERMKYSSMLLFIFFWELVVYYPICHWFWGGGWLEKLGVLDFAGGSVVHTNAGIAGLIAAIMLGSRKHKLSKPHNIILVAVGACILWIGWFGFNGGGALTMNQLGFILINTQFAACSAVLTWLLIDWMRTGKVSSVGLTCGAVTGLVAITPAAGYVAPLGAFVIGVISSGIGYFSVRIKHYLGYDDALDAFGIHGVGGSMGAILTGIFAASALGGVGLAMHMSMLKQVLVQLLGVVAVLAWSGGLTYIILKILKSTIGLRVPTEAEQMGLDLADHGERGYNNH